MAMILYPGRMDPGGLIDVNLLDVAFDYPDQVFDLDTPDDSLLAFQQIDTQQVDPYLPLVLDPKTDYDTAYIESQEDSENALAAQPTFDMDVWTDQGTVTIIWDSSLDDLDPQFMEDDDSPQSSIDDVADVLIQSPEFTDWVDQVDEDLQHTMDDPSWVDQLIPSPEYDAGQTPEPEYDDDVFQALLQSMDQADLIVPVDLASYAAEYESSQQVPYPDGQEEIDASQPTWVMEPGFIIEVTLVWDTGADYDTSCAAPIPDYDDDLSQQPMDMDIWINIPVRIGTDEGQPRLGQEFAMSSTTNALGGSPFGG